MKNSKALFSTLILILVVIMVWFGIYYIYLPPRIDQKVISEKNELLPNTYKVLSSESLWKEKIIKSDIPMVWNVSDKNIEIKESGTPSNFYCGEKKANFIEYSSYNVKNSIGGWGSVSIVDCGEYYFVYENSDGGTKLFGPFEVIGDKYTSATTTLQNSETTVSEKSNVDILRKTLSSSSSYSDLVLVPAKKFVKLAYPNGGEVLTLGSSQSITWTSSDGLDEKVNIEIIEYIPECYLKGKYICPPATPTAPLVIANEIPNMSKYNWVVGSPLTYGGLLKEGKKYKITVWGRDADNGKYIGDSSDNYFIIVAEKLKSCPDVKVNNQMPTSYPNNNPPAVYFILNSERRELSEFDLNWVGKNCAVKEEIVY